MNEPLIEELKQQLNEARAGAAKIAEFADTNDKHLGIPHEDAPAHERVIHQFTGMLQAYIASREKFTKLEARAAAMREVLQFVYEWCVSDNHPDIDGDEVKRVLSNESGKQFLDRLQKAEAERDLLKRHWLNHHLVTCLNHSPTERQNAGCPVCIKAERDQVQSSLDRVESALRQQHELAQKLDTDLQSHKSALQKASVAMKHFVTKCETGRAQSKESYNQFKDALTAIDAALSKEGRVG